MGTRSAIATRYPDGTVKGRYVHWDGYPEGVGHNLYTLIARDGLEGAFYTLTEAHYGWSNLDPSQKEDEPLGAGYSNRRFVAVPGYGVAYTEEQGQSDPDMWVHLDTSEWGIEYAYVISPKGLVVCKVGGDDKWQVLTVVPWGIKDPEEIAAAFDTTLFSTEALAPVDSFDSFVSALSA